MVGILMPPWRQLLLRRASDAETRLLYTGTLAILLLMVVVSITATIFGGGT